MSTRIFGRSWLAGTMLAALACTGIAPVRPGVVPPALASAALQFEEPLIPAGAPGAAENAALLAAITAWRAQPGTDNFSPFERYLAAYPHGGWRLSVLANLGLMQYHAGYFSRAIDSWQAGWNEGRASTDPRLKALTDHVAGELLRMQARLGHADAIAALMGDLGNRKLTGQATEELTGAKEGLWMMRHNPGVAYLCGPMALKNLLVSLGRPANEVQFLDDYRSGTQGVSLAEVAALATKAKLEYRLVNRTPGQKVPIPSVVHWKVHHFAAIVGEQNGRLHIKDPTFGRDLWVTRAALDAESDGYFLVVGPAPAAPWRTVGLPEAATIRGMGYTGTNDPTATTPEAPPACPCGGGAGMTAYNFTEMLVSLKLTDRPVGYTPPKGPAAFTTISYNQREASQPANFSFFNVSPKWSVNWLAYIQDDPTNAGANVTRVVGGGGSYIESYAAGNFAMETRTGATLALAATSPVKYVLTFANGSTLTYAASNGATSFPRLVFLSTIADQYGNTETLNYDGMQRLTSVVDATGRSTTFAYTNSSFPLQITGITDPFGRSASLQYDSSGRLQQIMDVAGIVSTYGYDASSLVNTLTTPYGTTSFSYGDNGNSRFLQATDPLGLTERVEYVQGAANVPFSDPPATVPNGIVAPFNQYLNDRDTYYWDKHAYAVAAGDYLQARQRHWVHMASNTNVTGDVIESIKYPLENRIWFNYPGQPTSGLGTAQGGTLDSPSNIGRVLDDGSTQLTQSAYNAQGLPTSVTDPVGRVTKLGYAANGIDLVSVQQKTGSAYASLAQFGNYANHQPQSYTDASGQTSTLAYNAAGQVMQSTDPLQNARKYNYDTNGYLASVVNANGQTELTLTRDSFGRVKTTTDSEGWSIAYTYDALDRILTETFPDKTTRTYTYSTLDLATVTDRQSRKTSYMYDADRRMTARTDPGNITTNFAYWENGKLKSVTDANGNTTLWNIDVEGRPTSKVYADGRTWGFTYENTTRRLKSILDPLGQTKQFTYAQDDQIGGIAYLNAVNATPTVSFAYDPYFERLSAMTDGSGTTSYAYGASGRAGANLLAQVTGPFRNATASFTRDALGRITQRRIGGNPETYGYDALGRVAAHADDLGEFSLGYLGQTEQITSLADGTVGTQWTYDSNHNDRRLLTMGSGSKARTFTYTTTAERDITGITETVGSKSQSWTNGYDSDDRLTSAKLGTASYAYKYDGANNLTSIKAGSGTSTIGYNSVNQVKAFNGTSFTYDANGNLTADDLHTYQWDAENRLIGIGTIGQAGVAESFRYDGDNHRYAAVVTNGGTSTETHYFWCGEMLCQARNERDKVTHRYFTEGEEAPAAGTLLYAGRDQNDSVRDVLSAANGSLLGSIDYDPYGTPIKTTGQVTTDYRYARLVTDSQSTLMLAAQRAYDSRLGRFISRDPIREQGGVNLYGYAAGNPVSYRDPSGLCLEDLCIGEGILLFEAGEAVVGLVEAAEASEAAATALEAGEAAEAAEGAEAAEEGEAAEEAEEECAETAPPAASTIQQNAANGQAFEQEGLQALEETQSDIADQVSVRPYTESGDLADYRVRLDAVGTDAEGNLNLTDFKSSETAGFTPNQTTGYPLLGENGGVVVGNGGLPYYPPGTVIPPTEVTIIRPGGF